MKHVVELVALGVIAGVVAALVAAGGVVVLAHAVGAL